MTEVLWISTRSPRVMAGSGSASSSDRAKAASSSSSGTSTGRNNTRSGTLDCRESCLRDSPGSEVLGDMWTLNSRISNIWFKWNSPLISWAKWCSEWAKQAVQRDLSRELSGVIIDVRWRVTLIPLSQKSPNPHSQVLFSSRNLTSV